VTTCHGNFQLCDAVPGALIEYKQIKATEKKCSKELYMHRWDPEMLRKATTNFPDKYIHHIEESVFIIVLLRKHEYNVLHTHTIFK
jgi:hypothetical protein